MSFSGPLNSKRAALDGKYDAKKDRCSQALKDHPAGAEFPDFESDLQSRDGPTPLSYDLSDVCKVLMKNLESSPILNKLTAPQLELIAQIIGDQTLYNTILATLETAEEKEHELLTNMMEKVFDVLDDAFFFGLLKDRVELDLRTRYMGRPHENELGLFAFYTNFFPNHYDRGERNPERLTPRHELLMQPPLVSLLLFKPRKNAANALTAWIGTLAHESLHAFLDIYKCECWKKCLEDSMDPVKGLGLSAHGQKYCEVLEGIEKCLSADFGLGYMSCDLVQSVEQEMIKSAWVPTEDQLERWGMNSFYAEFGLTSEQILAVTSNLHASQSRLSTAERELTNAQVYDWLRLHDEANPNNGVIAQVRGALWSKARIMTRIARLRYVEWAMRER